MLTDDPEFANTDDALRLPTYGILWKSKSYFANSGGGRSTTTAASVVGEFGHFRVADDADRVRSLTLSITFVVVVVVVVGLIGGENVHVVVVVVADKSPGSHFFVSWCGLLLLFGTGVYASIFLIPSSVSAPTPIAPSSSSPPITSAPLLSVLLPSPTHTLHQTLKLGNATATNATDSSASVIKLAHSASFSAALFPSKKLKLGMSPISGMLTPQRRQLTMIVSTPRRKMKVIAGSICVW
ncbi:hypothetical protein EX30DRAFT_192395 [Ascodesmis nigricans]|uniref:Uncharacterized protein n=1 Tax=Ascodesmis nigricans TaxID=341454 RepID=A0A4S2N121_9PEZI|nr:hypothetical protein EX30DRAFT_192395 [Ascodesmis nigricans]